MPRLRFSQTILIVSTLVLLAVAVGLIALRDRALTERQTVRQASTRFAVAVNESRQQLINLVHDIAGDKLLFQNLGWGYQNSVSQALQGRLRIGELEQIELVDGNCKSLAKVFLRQNTTLPCGQISGASQVTWHSAANGEGPPIIVFTLALNDPWGLKGTFQLKGILPFGEQWIASHHSLAAILARGDFTISKENEVADPRLIFVREGLETPANGNEPKALITLAGTNLTYQHVLARPAAAEFLRRTQIILILAAGTIVVIFWLRQKKSMLQIRQNYEQLINSLGEVPATNSPTATQGLSKKLLSGVLTWQPNLTIFKEFIDRQAAEHRERLNINEREFNEMKKSLAARDDDLIRLRHRLAELSELNALGEQLKRTTRAFANHIQSIRDAFEDLQSILSSGLRQEARTLVTLADKWYQGLNERGSRKFIRSLAETPGATPEKSALDDEIINLRSTSQSITDLSLNATMHAQKLVQAVTETAEVASMWDQLAHPRYQDGADKVLDKSRSQTEASTWPDVFRSLERLVKMDEKINGLKLSNLINANDHTLLPLLPITVWTAALYHLCLATGRNSGVVAIRFRQLQNKNLLVISPTGESDPLLGQRNIEQKYHLDVAAALLEPYGIECGLMPMVKGQSPIVISWVSSLEFDRSGTVLSLQERNSNSSI